MGKWRIIGLQILLSVLFSTTVLGQSEVDQSDEESVCGLRATELVFVQIEIEDELGRAVGDLDNEAFIIYEDGARQMNETFEKMDVFIQGKQRAIYRIGYYSTNDKLDGALRMIKVELKAEEKGKLRGRYYPVIYRAPRP